MPFLIKPKLKKNMSWCHVIYGEPEQHRYWCSGSL